MVSSFEYLRDPDDLEVTMGVTGGGVVTLVSAVCHVER
jgi:hypothetical protein